MKKYLRKIFFQAVKESEATVFSLLEEKSDAILLDCGCGNGDFTQRLMDKMRSLREVHGIELLKQDCKKAKKKGIIIHRDDLNTKFSLKDKSVDIVVANQVIEHLPNTDRFVSEIHRVLKPNGYVIISTENLASWHNIFALVLGWQPFTLSNISSLESAIGNPLGLYRKEMKMSFPYGFPRTMQHMRAFTQRALKEIFRIHGFEVEKIRGAGYYPLPGRFARLMTKIDRCHTAFLILRARKTEP